MTFEEAAIIKFPALSYSTTIRRKHVLEVCKNPAIQWPEHIINDANRIAHGLYNFNSSLVPSDNTIVQLPVTIETDEELDLRIKSAYNCMEVLTEAIGNGVTPSMIISGAAGVGKSHTVKRVLEKNKNTTVEFVKGYVKATGIYKLLWENRMSHQTLVYKIF